ncbi:MAG TPA: hypothetical protein VME23_04370 [Terracidiphilus sp.]|nr:hypothetical protein [Terracidiphilus sp.]
MTRSGNRFRKMSEGSKGDLTRLKSAQSRKSNRLQDAVYREMFLLESKRPGSEMGLALALLRAMVESEQVADREEMREWLKIICPHCLKMIESALNEYSTCATRPQQDVH